MILKIFAVLPLITACLGKYENSDANIYASVVQSLEELQDRQLHGPQRPMRADSVCYDELGCFDKNGTFKHLKQLPEPPETVSTKFLLYTRRNPTVPQFLDYKKPETILKSNIDPRRPLKFISHGFGGRDNLTWVWQMKTAFLEMEDVNVIAIDWSLGARVPYYIQATVNSEIVGAQAAVLYFFIKDNLKIQEKDLHFVGFSLGAHVAGFFGKRMQELRGIRPARITGLDPASPLFEDYGNNVHLYKDDADFVDIVHTNADLLLYGGVGIGKPIGHVDYYPNGGKRQPGCGSTLKGAIIDMIKGERERTCNHERAVHLFIDSILRPGPCKYTSYRCDSYADFESAKCMGCDDSCGQMGYHSEGTGVYYLMTKSVKPFCAAIAKLTVRYSETVKKSYGRIILTLEGGNGEKENVTISDKDEKLSPGGEKVFALPINDVFQPLRSIQALYKRYNGWFTKGTETFDLKSVTITDSAGKYIYKSCHSSVTLKDREYLQLKETAIAC